MATKRLYRDTENAMLGGVCAGIGNRFDLDPTLVRVAVLLLALVTLGTTLLIYLVLWIIVPSAPAAGSDAAPHRSSRGELTNEFRDAGGRLTQAGRIVGRAAKQAASELNELQRRPTAPPPVGDEARGAQAVNEDVREAGGPPGIPEDRPSGPTSNPLPPGGTPQGSDTMPASPTPPTPPPYGQQPGGQPPAGQPPGGDEPRPGPGLGA